MRAYHDEIVKNSLAYVALQYRNLTGYNVTQTIMYKILALFDYRCLKETGRPCTELDFYAERRGPVPHSLKDWGDDGVVRKKSAVINGHEAMVFECYGTPDTDYFSDYEQELLDSIIRRAVDEHWNTAKASEVSHDEIRAWAKGRERDDHRMRYADEFENLEKKNGVLLSPAESRFLIYSAASDLEDD